MCGAERMLNWYRLRWRIEDWHRVLKSGCKVEQLGHRREERIERAVAIRAVIAWRLTALTLLGRETPDCRRTACSPRSSGWRWQRSRGSGGWS